MAGNPLLESMMQPLKARVRWLFRLTNDDLDDVQMCGEHEQMYHAIAVGGADLAARLAYEHVHARRAGALAKAWTWSLVVLDPVEVTRTRQRERPESGRSGR
jgi:DNA-binding GntR family transcriptional regulator